VNQQTKKTQDRKINKREPSGENRPVSIAGNVQVQFGLELLGWGDATKKQKVLRGLIIILILLLAAIVLVILNNPQLAEKLIRIIETVVTLGQLIPLWRNAFGSRPVTNNK